MKIKDIMVRKPVTLLPSETVKEAFEKFAAHNISGCPVINKDDNVIGIFTETDLLATLKTQHREVRMLYPPYIPVGISFVETKKQKEALSALREIGTTRIENVMKTAVITASPDDSIETALQLMVENRVNRLPIVEDKKLIGIVTRGDVIKGIYTKTTSS